MWFTNKVEKGWLHSALNWLFIHACWCWGELALKWEKWLKYFTKQTNISLFPLQFSHFPHFARRFVALPCKIMVYLLSEGRDQISIVSAIKKGLTTGERWLCYAVVLLSLCRNTPIEMHEGILGFGETPTALWNWAALVFRDKKWGCFCLLSLTQPPAFTGFLWTPADCIVSLALFKQMSVW